MNKVIRSPRMVPRARDCEIIGWIRSKIAGKSWPEIAAEAGKKPGSVEQACRNVLQADIAESGEDFGGRYWE